MRVVLVDPRSADLLDVRADGNVVAREVVVGVVAEAGIEHALLEQRHPEPHGHPADELRAGGLRVDDPTGRKDAEQPGDPHLARRRVDAHLGELGTEGVPGERLVALDVLRRVDVHLARSVPVAQRPARLHDRRPPRRRSHRAACERRGRELGVAELEPHRLGRDAQRVGRDLRQSRPGAGADVGRRQPHDVGAVLFRPGARL